MSRLSIAAAVLVVLAPIAHANSKDNHADYDIRDDAAKADVIERYRANAGDERGNKIREKKENIPRRISAPPPHRRPSKPTSGEASPRAVSASPRACCRPSAGAVVEAFDLPFSIGAPAIVSDDCDHNGVADPGETIILSIPFTNAFQLNEINDAVVTVGGTSIARGPLALFDLSNLASTKAIITLLASALHCPLSHVRSLPP